MQNLFENDNLRITYQDPYLDVYVLNYDKIDGCTLHYIQKLHKDSIGAKIYLELIKEVSK